MGKLVIVGNCQARALAKIISSCTEETIHNIFIVHLETTDQSERFWQAIDASDYVLCQLTTDNYPCTHVRSSEIKKRCPGKTLVWPNLFHSGQQPLLRYITNLTDGRIMGPMDAYHNISVFNQWRVMRGLEGIVPLPDQKAVEDHSTASLKQRELNCDIKISDFITKYISKRRLFFTFNHPASFLLTELASRCCNALGSDFNYSSLPTGEPLGRISPPSPLIDDEDKGFTGNELVFGNQATITSGAQRTYNQDELLEEYYLSYDHQITKISDLRQLRFTPNFSR